MRSSKALFPQNAHLSQGSLSSHWTLAVHSTHPSRELLSLPGLAGEEGGSPYSAQPVSAGGFFTPAICVLCCSQPFSSLMHLCDSCFGLTSSEISCNCAECTRSTGTASRCSWRTLMHQPGKRLLHYLHTRSLHPPHLLDGSLFQLSMQRAWGHSCIWQRENRSWKLLTENSGTFITVLDYRL